MGGAGGLWAGGDAWWRVLGQAGTTVRGAYDVLVSMAIITIFIPYLILFAAMVRAQNKPAGPAVQRVPGGGRWLWRWRRWDL